jgi:hypothetical protein
MFRQRGAAGRKNQTGVVIEKVAGITKECPMRMILTWCFLAVLGKPSGYHPTEIAAGHSGLIEPAASGGKVPHVRTGGVRADVSFPKKGESGTQACVNQE